MNDLDRAEHDAESAGQEFEAALEHLRQALLKAAKPEAEAFIHRKIEAFGTDAGTAIRNVGQEAESAVKRAREAASAELDLMVGDDRVKAFAIVFSAGFLAGLYCFWNRGSGSSKAA